MKIVRESSEEEMIYEFLKAEYYSDRFSEKLKIVMDRKSATEKIIISADLHNICENALRKQVISEFRGYGFNQELFEKFPLNIDWKLCCFHQTYLENMKYIDYSYWNELSSGTHSPLVAAEAIRNGVSVYSESNEKFLQTAKYIENGGIFPKMIFLTADFEDFIIVEGHLRMTAYALAYDFFNEIEVIVGKCSSEELIRWS